MININCDLGEGLNNEHIIMPLINSCNIACGGHAGNNQSMIECVEIATRNNLQIGAHPSYPDRLNFGRKKIDEALRNSFKCMITNCIYEKRLHFWSLLKIMLVPQDQN